MKFYYTPAVSLSPETGDPQLILRPEITVRIFGPLASAQFRALVDTGADNTIFPKSVGERLGVELTEGRGPQLTAFGGQKLTTYFGDVNLEIEDGPLRINWHARVQFLAFPNADEESLVLGHASFLDYFSAVFSGEEGSLTLTANRELPASG